METDPSPNPSPNGGVDSYFRRFGFCPRQILSPPAPDLGLVVVIPCYDEPNLPECLESLWRCSRPVAAVEVIVVVNSAADCPEEIRARNRETLRAAQDWVAARRDPRLAFQLLHFPDLPPKHAGVGLARKIGMDEAALRFGDLGRDQTGVIVCFDADSLCQRNYLVALESHFLRHPRSPGCSLHFEHPLAGPFPPEIYEAVAAYELHLRYYVQALRWAGFPHAHHTVGSSMAVRAGVYKKQGGMNKRQAGEDFYFLHKIIPLGGFTQLAETTVIPSPRPSDRVPFGTGRAVRETVSAPGKPFPTYPLRAFHDLKTFFGLLHEIYAAQRENSPDPRARMEPVNQSAKRGATLPRPSPPSDGGEGEQAPRVPGAGVASSWPALPETVRRFLELEGFPAALAEIRANTSGEAAFRKRFFHWFNAFQCMKFVHFARDQAYGVEPVARAARGLLGLLSVESPPETVLPLLAVYRALDRQPWP